MTLMSDDGDALEDALRMDVTRLWMSDDRRGRGGVSLVLLVVVLVGAASAWWLCTDGDVKWWSMLVVNVLKHWEKYKQWAVDVVRVDARNDEGSIVWLCCTMHNCV